MLKKNSHFDKLQGGYLFPQIKRFVNELLSSDPDAKIVNLGIGDVTEPIPQYITERMCKATTNLSDVNTFSGYGSEQGNEQLRELIAQQWYHNKINSDDIFINDGAKCDLGRIPQLFESPLNIAVQDPSYPVYVDTSVIAGHTGLFCEIAQHYNNIIYLPCTPQNDFFPDINNLQADIIYFCSPNNPTGAVATKQQLQTLVDTALQKNTLIIFDSAYAAYIRDPDLPRSIYAIDRADEVAIEINSFSKMAGFTGVRLGWTVVPSKLNFSDGSPIKESWYRLITTTFNGASNIAQQGGIACFEPEGWHAINKNIDFYMENAAILKKALEEQDFTVYGATNTPYLWVHFENQNSWDIFREILHHAHIVTIPGAGFGPAGESFIRISAFNHRNQIEKATEQLQKLNFFVQSGI